VTAADPSPDDLAAHDVLGRGDMTVHGRIAGSSNATLLVTCSLEGRELLAVYKPVAGERDLWDFPPGLHRREVAAQLLADALGWCFVPETVLRDDAPFGPGSVQRVVEGGSDYFDLRDEERWHTDLRRIAAFDVVANNADRKAGHVILGEGRLWAIDHGLTFHAEPKLRTVIWDFAGDPLDDHVVADLRRLAESGLPASAAELLDDEEHDALLDRVAELLDKGRLPLPSAGRPYPWPLV
jgi:uncharacterized repeat protein (TIGR03843 family)